MAEFIKNLKNLKEKLKKPSELTEEELTNIKMMQDVQASILANSLEEEKAQEKIKEPVLTEYEKSLTKDQAKKDLEQRIAEKLSQMSIRDLDEFLKIQEEREKEREQISQNISERRQKRQESKRIKEEPIVIEGAILADFKYSVQAETETVEQESFLIAQAEEAVKTLEGQVAIRDLAKGPSPSVSMTAQEARPKPEPKPALKSVTELGAKLTSKLSALVPKAAGVNPPRDEIPEGWHETDASGEMLEDTPQTKPVDAADTTDVAETKPLREYDMYTDRIYAFFGRLFRRLQSKMMVQIEKIYEKNPEKKQIREKKNRRILARITHMRRRFWRREKEAAERMVNLINSMDQKNEDLADRTIVMVEGGTEKFNFAREWADLNKKKLLQYFSVAILISLGIAATLNFVTAYEYAYNGRVLGLVKNQEDVLTIVDLVSEQLSKEHRAEVTIDKAQDITFNRVFTISKDIDNVEDVLGRLTYMQDMNAKGYGIYVEGKRIAIVDSEDTADAILKHVQESSLDSNENRKYEEVGFAEKIEIKPVDTKLGRLQNPDDVILKIMTGAVAQKSHIVVAGETFSGIAKQYDVSMETLLATNPGVTPEKLSIGQELILSQAVPLLTVQTVEVYTYTKEIPFETTYENNDSYYIGEQKTKVAGLNGQEQVTSRIVKNNGEQMAELVLETTRLSEPITAVLMVGTKEPPPKQGTGSFISPVSGARLSSKYGSRWGRTHKGIDLACPTGTWIVASDGGTISFSGYSGSYGYVVKIDHGGGFTTVYAHCSKLLVKKGERVYQGQHIANVGSTGRSTGPHCHFEVQVNGVAKNPWNYI